MDEEKDLEIIGLIFLSVNVFVIHFFPSILSLNLSKNYLSLLSTVLQFTFSHFQFHA